MDVVQAGVEDFSGLVHIFHRPVDVRVAPPIGGIGLDLSKSANRFCHLPIGFVDSPRRVGVIQRIELPSGTAARAGVDPHQLPADPQELHFNNAFWAGECLWKAHLAVLWALCGWACLNLCGLFPPLTNSMWKCSQEHWGFGATSR